MYLSLETWYEKKTLKIVFFIMRIVVDIEKFYFEKQDRRPYSA